MDIGDVSDEVDEVSRYAYSRQRDLMIVDCLENLSVLREELEEGLFPPVDDEDEVYRDHLISTLAHAEHELERWTLEEEKMVPH